MKAYIQSGNVQEVVVGDDPMSCAKIAFLRQAATEEGLSPGQITSLSETGFDSDNDDDLFLGSQRIIDELTEEGKIHFTGKDI